MFLRNLIILLLCSLLNKPIQAQHNCNTYDSISWLPLAFIYNAKCACNNIPLDSQYQKIRNYLLSFFDTFNHPITNISKRKKIQFENKEISKRNYKKFIKKNIVSIVYQAHLSAYKLASCKGKPAPYQSWKLVCIKKIKNCKQTKRAIKCFGSCSGCFCKW